MAPPPLGRRGQPYTLVILGPQNSFLDPTYPFYSARQSKTPIYSSRSTLYFPEGFLEHFSVFLGSQFDFRCSRSVFSGESCSSELGQKNMDFWVFADFLSCPQNWQHGQIVKTTTLEKRKTTPESSSKTPGSILKSLPVFLTVPSSEARIFGKKLSSEALEKKSHNNWSRTQILKKRVSDENILK